MAARGLGTEDFEALDTRLTESAEAPQIGPPDAHGLCALASLDEGAGLR
jgi:hypothetical protein